MSGVFYFGYGAMVNPVSRKRRTVETVSEVPAILDDYRLTFAYGGAANILKQRGWSVHGVLLEPKTLHDWELIQEFDSGYQCLQLPVIPYEQNDPVMAHVFVMESNENDNAKLPTEQLPQERYVRIIAQGMRLHGVDADYIDYQILNVPYLPSRKPEDYLTFPVRVNKKGRTSRKKKAVKQLSFSEYQKKTKTGDDEAWFLVGTKIISLGEHDPQSPLVRWVKERLVGKEDCTWVLLQTLYDPDLPECESQARIQPQHICWAENQLMEKFEQGELKDAHQVASLKVPVEKPNKRERFSFLRSLRTSSTTTVSSTSHHHHQVVGSTTSFSTVTNGGTTTTAQGNNESSSSSRELPTSSTSNAA